MGVRHTVARVGGVGATGEENTKKCVEWVRGMYGRTRSLPQVVYPPRYMYI